MLENLGEKIVSLAGTVSLLIVIAYFINVADGLKSFTGSKNKWKRSLFLGAVGGVFGIYATYAGIDVGGAIISARDIGPMMAGVMGGPVAGILAGLIAGVHRYLYGGTTYLACSVATFSIGVISGCLYRFFKRRKSKVYWGAMLAIVMEILHLSLVFVFVTPFETALIIVEKVSIAFILVNSLGFALMLYALELVKKREASDAEKKRIESELNVATQIQSSLLPIILPDYPGRIEFDLNAFMRPAREVGGDFYDFFYTDDDHWAIIVADVSGKGVPAALFMVIAKTLLKDHLQSGESPETAFTLTNKQLCENNTTNMFVTVWMGLLEISTGKMTYVNAGHNPPLLIHNGKAEYLRTRSGFILAGRKKTVYHQHEIFLGKDDGIFVYTDGVSEAMNINEELYGEERLQEMVSLNAEKPPLELVETIRADVDLYAGEAEQFDDITALCLKYNGLPDQ